MHPVYDEIHFTVNLDLFTESIIEYVSGLLPGQTIYDHRQVMASGCNNALLKIKEMIAIQSSVILQRRNR